MKFDSYQVTLVNGLYSVLKTLENDDFETIDQFTSEEEADGVCKALNDGYYYSNEYGIECYMERAERLHNS